MGSRNTALAKTEPSAFPIMARSVSEITKTFLDNLGGEALTARDLERILVPQGKGTQWEVVGLDGVVESLPTLEGVVIHWRPKRARYTNPEPDGSPPACYSDDAQTGIGDPGGQCVGCFYDYFGSKERTPNTTTISELKTMKQGGAKGCSLKRELFILRPGNILPSVLVVPVMSVAGCKSMFLGLVNKGINENSVILNFGIDKKVSVSKKEYSRVTFTRGRDLDEHEVTWVRSYQESIRPMLRGVKVEDHQTEVA